MAVLAVIFKESLVATRYRIKITCTTYYVQYSNLISTRQRTTEEYIYYDTLILLYTSKLRSRPTWMCINSTPTVSLPHWPLASIQLRLLWRWIPRPAGVYR
jgi:hypothetical protein